MTNPFEADPTLKNRRSPKLVPFRGGYHTVKDIAALTGLRERTIYHRLSHDLPLDGKPRRGKEPRRIMFEGEELTIAQIQERTGLSRSQVSKRTCGDRFIAKGSPEEALWREQHSKARLLFHDCRKQSVSAWARETGIPRHTITDRLKRGWSVKRALTTPFKARFRLMLRYDGKTLTPAQWAKRLGCSRETIRQRLFAHGWPIDRALTEPAQLGRRRKGAQSIAHAPKRSGLIRIRKRRPLPHPPGGSSQLSEGTP